MARMNRMFAVALACLAAWAPVHAQAGTDATARTLSRAVFVGVMIGAEKSAQEGGVSASEMACLRAIDPETLVGTYRRLIEDAFTAEEIATLDAFFGSPLGALEFRRTADLLRVSQGLPPRDSVTLTDAQQREIDAFRSSPLSRRLDRLYEEGNRAARDVVSRDIQAVLRPCVDA